jgi:hypothetical protein
MMAPRKDANVESPSERPEQPNSDSDSAQWPETVTTDRPPADDIDAAGDDLMAKIDAAIAQNEAPQYSFTPALPGHQPDPFAPPPDPGETHAADLSDEDRRLIRNGLTELLPVAVRLVRLHLAGKGGALDAVLTAIGFPETGQPGDEYTEADPSNPQNVRKMNVPPNMVRVHPERQRVYEALSEATK